MPSILKLPLFGPLLQKAAMSRFASIFAILQASGVPVMQAMEILSGTIGNAAISQRVRPGPGTGSRKDRGSPAP